MKGLKVHKGFGFGVGAFRVYVGLRVYCLGCRIRKRPTCRFGLGRRGKKSLPRLGHLKLKLSNEEQNSL